MQIIEHPAICSLLVGKVEFHVVLVCIMHTRNSRQEMTRFSVGYKHRCNFPRQSVVRFSVGYERRYNFPYSFIYRRKLTTKFCKIPSWPCFSRGCRIRPVTSLRYRKFYISRAHSFPVFIRKFGEFRKLIFDIEIVDSLSILAFPFASSLSRRAYTFSKAF